MSLMVAPAGNNPLNEKQPPTGRARRKVDKLEVMEDRRAREVTFSKRRQGMFTKASELSVLCGAEIGIVVFSPSGNPFVFGHPDPDAIFERYLAGGSEWFGNRFFFSDFSEQEEEYKRVMKKLEKTRQGQGTLPAMTGSLSCWWDEIDAEIGVMDTEELELCVQSMERLMGNVRDELERTETALDASDLEFLQRECGFSF